MERERIIGKIGKILSNRLSISVIGTAVCCLALSIAGAQTAPNINVPEEQIIELRWDRAVADLETILSNPASGKIIPELADRMKLVEQRLSGNKRESMAAYIAILKVRLVRIQEEKGGVVAGDKNVYSAMVGQLNIEENRIRTELSKLLGGVISLRSSYSTSALI